MSTKTVTIHAWEPYKSQAVRNEKDVESPNLEERFRNLQRVHSTEKRCIAWVARNHPEVYEEMDKWAKTAKPALYGIGGGK